MRTTIETGNMGPDIARDENGRAYWGEGARITINAVQAIVSGDEGEDAARHLLEWIDGLSVLGPLDCEFIVRVGG